jgi:thermostable 8-oxoguanine DNA glycosylase
VGVKIKGKIKTLEEIKEINPNISYDDYLRQYNESKVGVVSKKIIKSSKDNIDKSTLYEIALWKIGRYLYLDEQPDLINAINNISSTSQKLNVDETRIVMAKLLEVDGISLPMASTILRFRNPQIYQIIDKHMKQVITGKPFVFSYYNKTQQIEDYLEYLDELRNFCFRHKIQFEEADQILFKIGQEYNYLH